MEKNQNNEVIITRLVRSHAPSAVVIVNMEKSSRKYVDDFLSMNATDLVEASIIPIRLDCNSFTDKVSFWKGIAKTIKKTISSDYEWSDDAMDAWKCVELSYDTYFLKEAIITIAQEYLEETGWRFLLIFEDFESILEKMDKEDSLKVRALSLSFTLLTITHTPLRELGERFFNDVYYCNMFASFKID